MSGCLSDIDVAVLCGGKGTRLAPIIGDLPKVLAPIKGRPFIEWHVEYLRRYGAKRIALLGGYGGRAVSEWLDANDPDISFILDRGVGQMMALKDATHWFNTSTVMVTNGDTLLHGRLDQALGDLRPARNPMVFTVGGRSTGVFLISRYQIGATVQAVPIEVLFGFDFLDIGTPEGYAKAEAFLDNQ